MKTICRYNLIKIISACLFVVSIVLEVPFLAFAQDIELEGGDTTVSDDSISAFGHPLANLSSATSLGKHDLGEKGFRRDFSREPIRGQIRVGPRFNNVSCIFCHTNNGRGEPKIGRRRSESVVKVSANALNDGKTPFHGGPVPLPGLGLQILDHALFGVRPEATVKLDWEPVSGAFEDGTPYSLRRPVVSLSSKGKKLPTDIMMSLRRPPPIFGSGLIDAIDVGTLRVLADPEDLNHDGISGKVNVVWEVARKRLSVGKFGFKAGAPSALQQIATAYAVDMGVTNPIVQLSDRAPDIDRQRLDRTVFYTQTLAVPRARYQNLPEVQLGKLLFTSLSCHGCHVMTLSTGQHLIPELSNQVIHPFSDFLLHDMGPDLADNRPEFSASGSEWRTTPLWGIGLTSLALNGGEVTYLHDGRARSLQEAIIWHDGEASRAKQGFLALGNDDRAALIAFLNSL